jgi:Right handed beta helix region
LTVEWYLLQCRSQAARRLARCPWCLNDGEREYYATSHAPSAVCLGHRAHGCLCLDQCRAAAGRRWRHRPGRPGALYVVANSGGNGVSNQPGARVLIMRNELRQHGQHGLLLSGPQEAVVLDNHFVDNGTKQFRPTTPRPAAGRQGHHIFVQGKSGGANSLVIAGNTMQRAFADGLALVVFFDEADDVTMYARVLNNTIEASERRGVTIAGSFGPSHNRVTIDVSHNTIRHNGAQAIGAQAARPLVTQLIRDSYLCLHIADNDCQDNGEGIVLFGGFGPAEDNVLDATVLGNRITGTPRHAVRVIGGVGFGGYAAQHNRVRGTMSRNHITEASEVPVFLQGGTAEGQETATDNTVVAQLLANDLPTVPGKSSVLLNDGLPGNTVYLENPVPPYETINHPLPYQA